jgi:hypothetical protein
MKGKERNRLYMAMILQELYAIWSLGHVSFRQTAILRINR